MRRYQDAYSARVRIGVIGGTGPAGSALAARLASAGLEVVIGSRTEERGTQVVAEIAGRWPSRELGLQGGSNPEAAQADLVILATPWEAVLDTAKELAEPLTGKVVISMANALARWGGRMIPLVPPTGSIAQGIAAALPGSRVAAGFHHLPAGRLADLDAEVEADVLVCSATRATTDEVIEVIARVPGLRGVDAGGLESALALETLTAVLIEVNRRYRTHASIKVTGL
jgi:NADPH-dependent F420 reductase